VTGKRRKPPPPPVPTARQHELAEHSITRDTRGSDGGGHYRVLPAPTLDEQERLEEEE
jgi:hypothetical protein